MPTPRTIPRSIPLFAREINWWPDWTIDAACVGYDPEIFFDLSDKERTGRYNNRRVRKAKEICHTCPVIKDCLIENLRVPYGVFGGTTPIERWRLLGRHGHPSSSKPAFLSSGQRSTKSPEKPAHRKSAASSLTNLRNRNGYYLNDHSERRISRPASTGRVNG